MNNYLRQLHIAIILTLAVFSSCSYATKIIGSGDLGIVIERATGSIKIINTSSAATIGSIKNLGDLSHASVVYSRDMRYAYLFGRDGGLTKVDTLKQKMINRVVQSGNSIGGAISQDGKLIAVSNYEPGGVKIFDSESLELLHDIPASYGDKQLSKVVGLVDAPGQQFVFSLFDADEIWIVDLKKKKPIITKFKDIGHQPYDALITPEGRYYLAGLFGEDGIALLDLWHPEKGVQKILQGYGRNQKKLPVYKMPHLEGWAIAGNKAFLPAIGQHEVIIVNTDTWTETGRIKLHGQPVFAMAQPDARQVWINFAIPHNDTIQVIDTDTETIRANLKPGKGALHMEFTPRGEQVWISIRDENRVDIFDTLSLEKINSIEANKPSGIFFSARAHKIGL